MKTIVMIISLLALVSMVIVVIFSKLFNQNISNKIHDEAINNLNNYTGASYVNELYRLKEEKIITVSEFDNLYRSFKEKNGIYYE